MKEGLLHLADGRELGYAEYGAPDGQPVLYCHGFPTCRLELVPSESIIQALDAPPRVIAIDRPGFTIHGLEETADTRALVLELVEGPTLAERIAQGPIPLDETIAIASQIADALEAAHERGVIHRDLKPANVKVKDDGRSSRSGS